MANIRFNLLGYRFQQGVELLRTSFDTSSEALNNAVIAAHNAEIADEAAVDAGGEWIGERDSDGQVIWDQHQVLGLRSEASRIAAGALGKAYAIAAYHHWERLVHLWADCDARATHERLAAATLARGYPVAARLGDVRNLVNALKHGSDRWGERLEANWPELVRQGRVHVGRRTDWYESIELTDSDVHAVLDAVSGSGPTADMLPSSA